MPHPIASTTPAIPPEPLSAELSRTSTATPAANRPSSSPRGSLPALLAVLSPFKRHTSSSAALPAPTVSPREMASVRPRNVRAAVEDMAALSDKCVDNVSEGFSAVDHHEVARDIKAGPISQPELQRWAGRQFRLGAVEKEVHGFLDRATDANRQRLEQLRDQLSHLVSTQPSTTDLLNSIVTSDASPDTLAAARSGIQVTRRQSDALLALPDFPPEGKQKIRDAIPLLDESLKLIGTRTLLLHKRVETMLHAKAKLRNVLDLPESTSSTMVHEMTSMLDDGALRAIGHAVRAREADPKEMGEYLLSNETWRAGMEQCHPDRFKQMRAQFGDDPFRTMIGGENHENVPGAVAFKPSEKAAAELTQRMKAAEDTLLLEYAGALAPGHASAAVVGNLEAIKARFEALQAGNWLSATDDEKYDTAMLPALVMAENARTPGLNLHFVSSTDGPTVGGKVNQLPFLERHRVLFALPPTNRHWLTADVRRSRGKTSVIAIEPLSPERASYQDYWAKHHAPFLKSQFGEDVSVTVLTLDTQISGSDCAIYALSHASKMADNAALFDALHRQNLSGAPLKTSLGAEAKKYVEDGPVRVVDGMGILPSDFVKHVQSDKTLDAWMSVNPPGYANASVNKAGQSLAQRYDTHATTRFRSPQQVQYARGQGRNPPVSSTRTSPSIEQKRLTYIDRAIAYFSQASEAQSAQALASMKSIDRTSADMRQPGAHWRREWGPSPDTQRRT